MPTNKPFFPNLRPVKKALTPQGQLLIRKECGADRSSWESRSEAMRKMYCEKNKTEMRRQRTARAALVIPAVATLGETLERIAKK
jgi:hypothetical protein